MNLLLFIPTYNDNLYFYSLINKIKNFYTGPILCIDDCSNEKIVNKNTYKNLLILNNKSNMGKGYCIIKASKYAIENNFTHLLVIDSDLQHDPSKIHSFINKNKNIDIVYGKRNFYRNMPFIRLFSNVLTSLILSIRCKRIIYDSQCGYRRYKLEIFKNKNLTNLGYQLESEILIKCLNKSSKIDFVKIPTIYNNNQSNINHFYDTLKFIKLILLN